MPDPTGEFARIAALTAGLPAGERVIVGPGDDAAVLRPAPGHDLVATTDTFVEGRHFRRDLMSAAEAGARFAAANLSDLAAMAAAPRWALVSLSVPLAWSRDDCDAFERDCARALALEGAAIVGGNLTATDGPFTATLTLLGEAAQDRAWTRGGARAGDVLAVSGVPGSAAAALALALWGNPPSWSRVPAALREAYVSPPARVKLACALAATGGVRAAVDLSDGLSGDLAHVCTASGVGACVHAERLPVSPALREAARALSAFAGQERGPLPASEAGVMPWFAWGPSDDYELLLAVDPAQWAECERVAHEAGAPLTRIGEFVNASDGLLRRELDGSLTPIPPRAWDHFPGPDRGSEPRRV